MATDRSPAGIQIATRVVSRISARPGEFGFALAGAGHERTASGRAYPRTPDEMFAPAHARPGRISERLRGSFAQQISSDASILDHGARRGKNRQLRAGGIANGNFRRQFQLARPGLASNQLPPNRIAPAISSLLR